MNAEQKIYHLCRVSRYRWAVSEFQRAANPDEPALYQLVTGPLKYAEALAAWRELVGLDAPTRLPANWVE